MDTNQCVPTTVTVRSLLCHGVYWQCNAPGSSIVLNAWLKKEIIAHLVVDGNVLATMRLEFKRKIDRDNRMVYALENKRLELIAGTSKITR